MLDILFSPLDAIASAKTERNTGKTVLVLFVASLLASLNIFITTKKFSGTNLALAFGILIGVFLLTLFIALLLQLALHILSQRGGYYEALTTLSYGFFIMSCGYLISSIIELIPSTGIFLRIIVSVLSGLVLLLAFIMSNAVMLRTAVELFQTDLFTVIVALMIVYIATFLTIYLVIIKTLFASLFGMAGGLGSSPLGGGLPTTGFP